MYIYKYYNTVVHNNITMKVDFCLIFYEPQRGDFAILHDKNRHKMKAIKYI